MKAARSLSNQLCKIAIFIAYETRHATAKSFILQPFKKRWRISKFNFFLSALTSFNFFVIVS